MPLHEKEKMPTLRHKVIHNYPIHTYFLVHLRTKCFFLNEFDTC